MSTKKETSSKLSESIFTDTEIIAIRTQLRHVLEKKKMFLNHALTLSDLANELAISEKKLSIFVNQNMQIGYYELVNQYRLQEFKTQIQDPKNKIYSLMAIANQCGFKSKTSFYSYFKKQTGYTPSEYLNSLSS